MQRSDIERLSSSSDERANWFWNRQAEWHLEDPDMQLFYEKWRSEPFKQPQKFPYIIGLGTNSNGRSLLQFLPQDTANSEIVITRAYEDMYNRILSIREGKPESDTRGVVLTGQPGIGKTTFLKYMLRRLISARQVVLLLSRYKVTLFYAGQAYYRSATDAFLYVPTCKGKNKNYAWALIDIDPQNSELPLDGTTQVWPIQASSPNPVQWKLWSKEFNAAKWGMPLWTVDELVFGLRLQNKYIAFRRNLKKVIHEKSISPSNSDDALKAAFEVLMYVNVDDIASDQDMETITRDVDSAMEVLVWNAVANYGFAPRVVYGAIFQPSLTNEEHEKAIAGLSYEALEKLIRDFRRSGVLSTDIGHHLVSVSPIMRYEGYPLDSWTINFKSIRIAKKVVVAMKQEEDQRLWQIYSLFHSSPMTSSLAGYVFEAIAHRILCKDLPSDAEAASSVGVALAMHFDGGPGETPTFSTAVPSSAFGTSLAPALPLLDNGRKDTITDLACSFDNFQADGDTYYIFKATHNLLFDSFTITFDPSRSTALISVFLMTISRTPRGSTKSYGLIRAIMERVSRLNPNFKISVAYWLVCPASTPSEEWSWTMPDGWDTNTIVNDHRGDVFCLRIPVRF